MLGHMGLGLPRQSATDIAPGAALSYVGSIYIGPIGNLVDGNDSTLFCLDTNINAKFVFDFTVPRKIWKVSLGNNGISSIVFNGKIIYSDDGVAWSDTNQNAISLTYSLGTLVDYAIGDFGPHRFWGLGLTAAQRMQLSTVKMYATYFA